MKTLGVLGGMGPAATLDFLAKLQAATPAARDQDHIRVLVDINPQVPDRNTEGDAAGPVLANMAVRLRDAGAEVLAIACNTAHAFVGEVREASGLPLVDMIDEACAAARIGGARKVGVLATGAAQGLYAERLRGVGLEPVLPTRAKQELFMNLLYRIKAGDLGEDVEAELALVAYALADAGAEAVIAGCTEVPLVLGEDSLEIPLIDAGRVLAERCVKVCTR